MAFEQVTEPPHDPAAALVLAARSQAAQLKRIADTQQQLLSEMQKQSKALEFMANSVANAANDLAKRR